MYELMKGIAHNAVDLFVCFDNICQGFSRSMGVLSIAEFRKLDLSPIESAQI